MGFATRGHQRARPLHPEFVLPSSGAPAAPCTEQRLSLRLPGSAAMSIITYILLSALHTGLQSRFHPEVLGLTASKALGVVLLEFMALKLGTYLLDVKGGGAGAWEVGFYGGYKFVGCVLVPLYRLGR